MEKAAQRPLMPDAQMVAGFAFMERLQGNFFRKSRFVKNAKAVNGIEKAPAEKAGAQIKDKVVSAGNC